MIKKTTDRLLRLLQRPRVVPRQWQQPHCDPRMLHAPGECQTCDHFPDWQQLRTFWGIAFTGHEAQRNQWTVELPCPFDLNRPGQAGLWGGNDRIPIRN